MSSVNERRKRPLNLAPWITFLVDLRRRGSELARSFRRDGRAWLGLWLDRTLTGASSGRRARGWGRTRRRSCRGRCRAPRAGAGRHLATELVVALAAGRAGRAPLAPRRTRRAASTRIRSICAVGPGMISAVVWSGWTCTRPFNINFERLTVVPTPAVCAPGSGSFRRRS